MIRETFTVNALNFPQFVIPMLLNVNGQIFKLFVDILLTLFKLAVLNYVLGKLIKN